MDAKLINSTTDLTVLVPGLRGHGRYHIGPCPFCGGDDRFTIKRTDDGDLWICRQCGDGKYHDALAFRMRAEGKSFREVTGQPGRRPEPEPGRGREAARGKRSAPPPLLQPPDEEWQVSRLVAQQQAAGNLWLADAPQSTRLVWHYLRAYRGLWPDTIRRYMLGYNPEGAQLPDGSAYPPGIHIPCLIDGQLWYVKARLPKAALHEAAARGKRLPKYMMLRDSRTALFNAGRLVGARVAVVVEGEFDAMLLGQFLPDGWAAVTMGGAAALPGPAFLPYFGGLERVLLCLDNDDAGRRALDAWRGLLAWAEVAPPLPAGAKDLTDFWRMQGDINEWITQCANPH
ncbi:MAG: toprim domain-containing protein [Candidatus Promineofilum sp.]|nr:toprim domain-containing protein [Promineifilum sp.]